MPRVLRTIRRMARRLNRAIQFQRLAAFRRLPIVADQVLYESFGGSGVLDNPEALFRTALADPTLAHLRHVWALDRQGSHAAVRREFAGDPRVRFVAYRSGRYFKALSTSGYLVNNATFPTEFGKRPGQVYLNTWHGTPLKLMGYDMPNGALESANTMRNFFSADYLLAQNSFMTETMYDHAYKLGGAYRGTVVEEGYPRVDRQFADAAQTADARGLLENAGLDIGSREIVLYAPTWKGGSFSRPENDVADLAERVRVMQERLGSDRYVVLLKTHQAVAKFAIGDAALRRILVPNSIPTNVVLGLTSALVTDYSSIFFDFLATGRPIVFFAPPDDEYEEVRGTYFTPEELPGPVVTTPEAVAEALAAMNASPADAPTANYDEWRTRFTGLDDGSVSRRVIDIVFHGRRDGYRLRTLGDSTRRSVLLYLGGMRSNGITTSALNLLAHLDHNELDVSVLIARPGRGQQGANQRRIHPAVRQFIRLGGMNGDKREHVRRRIAHFKADGQLHLTRPQHMQLWDDEWLRTFGSAQFDAVIDFSGYSAFWATLLLHSPGGTRSVWLHNDMLAEVDRRVAGKLPLRRSLRAMFALYPQFDNLVSVSPSLDAINRERLSPIIGGHPSFSFARNVIDADRVLLGASELPVIEQPAAEPRVADTEAAAPAAADDPAVEAESVEPEGRTDVAEALPIAIDWADTIRSDSTNLWFITVGRLSPEKNQARLLRAFAATNPAERNLRLLIVGGGALQEELEALVRQLGLEETAFLSGAIANPFPLVDAADCFVLSSNYEGQPMVLLEAAVLDKPIITVDFGSVRDALPGAAIRIVPSTDEALSDALLAFVRGEIPPSHIDPVEYNRATIGEFEHATGILTD
ncbi:MAG: tagF [Glaciihabitans sp.]|nr:tagF [Glaciihabitans sp.]